MSRRRRRIGTYGALAGAFGLALWWGLSGDGLLPGTTGTDADPDRRVEAPAGGGPATSSDASEAAGAADPRNDGAIGGEGSTAAPTGVGEAPPGSASLPVGGSGAAGGGSGETVDPGAGDPGAVDPGSSAEAGPGPVESRSAALLALFERSLAEGDLALAASALSELEAASLPEPTDAAGRLGRRIDQVFAAVLADVDAGDIPAAAERIAALRPGEVPAVATALRARSRPLDFPDLHGGVPPGADGEPADLPRRRFVAWRGEGGALRRARVADGAGVRIAVRIDGPDGVAFPTVARADLVLVDADLTESLSQARACFAADRPIRGRLWLVRAVGLRDADGDAEPEILAELAELVERCQVPG